MALTKSLDEMVSLIAALLYDISRMHREVFSHTACVNTIHFVRKRASNEGSVFLTQTLAGLGRALDRALSAQAPLKASELRFEAQPGSELPVFLGEFFNQVLDNSGNLLAPEYTDASSVAVLRQVLYLFYKYELPYTDEQEQAVISRFVKTEEDLSTVEMDLDSLKDDVLLLSGTAPPRDSRLQGMADVARKARERLFNLFSHFNPTDIKPCHGPGVVATKQRLWDKYKWTNVSERITDLYPFDAYFCASLGHVCDRPGIFEYQTKSLPARVLLVPKDSRGPRLISCEPVDFQWVQQGMRKAIVALVESHPITRGRVHFTDQEPNREAARFGSASLTNATLDLKDASDRVSCSLVRLLFPSHISMYLECCRSLSTVLPSGEEIILRKFAPMGSALCFPVMALTIWSLLDAAAPDEDTRNRILVYGDDVVVPRRYARDATEVLEAFGLLVNREKSCSDGLFRESCGLDAFNGFDVTPVKLKTVWNSSRSPNVYSAYVAYATEFWNRGCFGIYDEIVARLHRSYGAIPEIRMGLNCPSLPEVTQDWLPRKYRINHSLQKREWKVWDIKAPIIRHEMDGYLMLLRYFAEKANDLNVDAQSYGQEYEPRRSGVHRTADDCLAHFRLSDCDPFCVSSYTPRGSSILVRRWR